MDFRDQDHDEFDNESPWPRRLLHVPTMTSLKWQPGNTYGGHKEPPYHALSYTWGRWHLKNDRDLPTAHALKVRDVLWPIPRIHPDHFTAAEFEVVVSRAVKAPPAYSEEREEYGTVLPAEDAVEFLWLDVACIDQRHTHEAYAEVGRQARIFRGARRVFVWLSHHTAEALLSINDDIIQATHATNGYYYFAVDVNSPENRDWPAKAVRGLSTLLQDPWFSSLWTLQEAFLSPKAFILSKEAKLIHESRHQNSPLLLHYFFSRGEQLSSTAEECLSSASHADADNLHSLVQLLNTSGFSALGQYNPMSILAVARFRKASFELDRVYGIMQIFGDNFHVGKSRGDRQSVNKKYTLSELEDELGALLLQEFPVLSQLHVHEQQPSFGKGWLMSNMSSVPPLATLPETYHENSSSSSLRLEDIRPEDVPGMDVKLEDLKFAEPVTVCKFSTRKVGDILWGYLSGRACPFDLLQAAWQRQFNKYGSSTSETLAELALDKGPAADNLPTHDYLDLVPIPDGTGPLRSHIAEHNIAACLAAKFRGRRLVMFLMGQKRYGVWTIEGEDKPRPDIYRGMILLQNDRNNICHWQRVGICRWSSYNVKVEADESQDKDILLVRGASWQPIEGLFG